jgi:hypothetical protein
MPKAIGQEVWVTYSWRHHRRRELVCSTRLATEAVPRRGYESRRATDDEIATEKQKRKEHADDIEKECQFKSRPDYIAARAIREILEWIKPECHPLDKLTVAEWEELRRKLEGE